jgi:hypothetical protein
MVSIVPLGRGLPEIPSGFIKDSGFGGEDGRRRWRRSSPPSRLLCSLREAARRLT